MTQTEALRLALEALENITSVSICEATHHAKKDRHLLCEECPNEVKHLKAITAIKAALEAKDEPYGFEASIYSNARMKVDSVTGNVSIGTVKKPCGLECDCTDVCKQDDYKALWQQMCERCDELDKKLAQRKPLTDEEMKTVVEQELVNYWDGEYIDTTGARDCLTKFARAIEAAHGIKGEI